MITEGLKYGKCTNPDTGEEIIVTDDEKEEWK